MIANNKRSLIVINPSLNLNNLNKGKHIKRKKDTFQPL
jgi:hypothetical protein